MYTITKVVDFAAAHSIKDAGKCANKHGHNWEATITVKADKLNPQGFIADVAEIKEAAFRYDHDDLDRYFGQPTTEIVCERIAHEALMTVQQSNKSATYISVDVHLVETKNNSADAFVDWDTEMDEDPVLSAPLLAAIAA